MLCYHATHKIHTKKLKGSYFVPIIVNLRMIIKLLGYVFYLVFWDFPSANWTLLNFRDGVLDDASVLVLFALAGHEPVSVHADQVEAVVALVDAGQVESVRETLVLAVLLTLELLETNGAPALHRVIIRRNNFSHLLVKVIHKSGRVSVFFLFIS